MADALGSPSVYDTVKSQQRQPVQRIEIPSKSALFVQFRHIHYETRRNQDEPMSQIINDVSGYARPGAILCILGPSGAGKTTLLNIVARKIKSRGQVLINDEFVPDSVFKHIAAYVPQEDILMGSLSARELLTFTADLLLPQHLSAQEKQAKVQGILKSLGLLNCADTPIGYVGTSATHSGFKRGISGGERKRVSIGLELITNPQIIILDEPTSGLDSFSAKVVVSGLKSLAKQGRTVITTIHQPSIEIFVKFDDLLILAEGQTIYFGDARKSLDYFARAGYACPPHRNPASYFLKILYTRAARNSSSVQSIEQSAHARLSIEGDGDLAHVDKSQALHLIQEWKDAPESRDCDKSFQSKESLTQHQETFTAPAWKQILWVFLRSLKNNLREPLMVRMRLGQSIFIALVAGLIYFDRDNDQVALRDRSGAIFFLLIGQMIGGMNGPMFLFPAERAIFLRENASGLYSSFNYFLGRCMSDLPISIFAPLVFSAIVHPMVNFNEGSMEWFTFYLSILLIGAASSSLGILLGCAIHNFSLLFVVQPAIMFPVILFGGLYVNLDTAPPYLAWIEEVSFMKFVFRAALNNEFEGVEYYCKEDQYVQIDPTCGQPIVSSTFTNSTLRCPIESGDQYLEQLAMTGHEIWEDLLVVVGFWCKLWHFRIHEKCLFFLSL
eukprot:TRINITY_DN3264_c0_g2_i7.p1 TRINITY_DN3264_c0_g2~~TRINITY_DN3264_c0_g2_i7.p1  ORF type:complete len:669 (+),score=124.78 TRINITY_DN3264_c0_g2_i7:53-2059(+)